MMVMGWLWTCGMHRSHVQTPYFILDGCCEVAEIAPVSYMAHIWPILGHGLGMGQGGVQPKNLVRK
jgi:hypothetical protein